MVFYELFIENLNIIKYVKKMFIVGSSAMSHMENSDKIMKNICGAGTNVAVGYIVTLIG